MDNIFAALVMTLSRGLSGPSPPCFSNGITWPPVGPQNVAAINAATSTQRTAVVAPLRHAGDRRAHRTGNIREDIHARPSIAGTLRVAISIASCSARAPRPARLPRPACRPPSTGTGKPVPCDGFFIAQAVGDQPGELPIFEHAVPSERVQVHARHLPRSIAGDLLPVLGSTAPGS